jgi:hypothetical protein
VDDNKINDAKQYTYFAGNFDHHADVLVQSGAHCPIAHIHGLTRSHWMPLSGKCLCCITPAAAKVIDFGCKHKNTNKTQLLASLLTVDQNQKLHQFWTPKRTVIT